MIFFLFSTFCIGISLSGTQYRKINFIHSCLLQNSGNLVHGTACCINIIHDQNPAQSLNRSVWYKASPQILLPLFSAKRFLGSSHPPAPQKILSDRNIQHFSKFFCQQLRLIKSTAATFSPMDRNRKYHLWIPLPYPAAAALCHCLSKKISVISPVLIFHPVNRIRQPSRISKCCCSSGKNMLLVSAVPAVFLFWKHRLTAFFADSPRNPGKLLNTGCTAMIAFFCRSQNLITDRTAGWVK